MVIHFKFKGGSEEPFVCSIKVRINLLIIEHVVRAFYEHAVNNLGDMLKMLLNLRLFPIPYIM